MHKVIRIKYVSRKGMHFALICTNTAFCKIIQFYFSIALLFLRSGARPFDCPHCDKKFRTSGHRKSHIASHFKNLQLKKRFPRKPAKMRILKNSVTLTDIPLQEPILITDSGKAFYYYVT